MEAGITISSGMTKYSTSGGYACAICGYWTNWGETHFCNNTLPQTYYPSYTSIESGRLAERKLSKIRRIIGDAFG